MTDTIDEMNPICLNDKTPGTTTVVTALYNIGRDNLTGVNAHRPFAKYLEWFQNLLLLNTPMVIFIPNELHSYVLEHRPPKYSTKIIIREFTELAAYHYHDRIQTVINRMVKEPNPNGVIPSYFKECPEFITARYETIVYSKFDFLHEVASNNPYNTDYFIWLDAGTWYQTPPFDYTMPWPDPYKIQTLGNKFLLSNYSFDIDNTAPLKDKREYLRRNQNDICAFILGGTREAIDRVHKLFWNEVNNSLTMGVINNEQHLLQLMALQHPEYYHLWYRTRYNYPKLQVPLRDRMIPCELAVGTFMGENYSINPNIKLLTVATKEISQISYQTWIDSAKYYGYNYSILGQSIPWAGFKTKITEFYKALQSVTEPYTVLTDSIDLFFCGSSHELYHKFRQVGYDLVIGGELRIYYPCNPSHPSEESEEVNSSNNRVEVSRKRLGRYTKDIMRGYFESIKESPQAFPNSGFIMGKTEDVRRLMELHLEYDDDQSACFDTCYEKLMPLVVDYKTALIGNVPNYHEYGVESTDYFVFDPQLRRYKNIYNNETPVVFHFPGKNMHAMQKFYAMSQADVITQQQQSPSATTGWIFLVVVIILFLVVVFAWVAQTNQ